MSAAKSGKAPINAVLVVGSGYGALKAAEDLSHGGIPVAWVTKAQHFLELPAGVKPFEEWPADLNYQFRPLYLRVTRHPLVTTLTQAHLVEVERSQWGYRVEVEQDPEFVDFDLCTGCGRCMRACPLADSEQPPITRTPGYCPSRAVDLNKRHLSPCRLECPLGVNAQAYLALTKAGRPEEALAVIREDNPLPGVCGRVCHHPCESACRRAELDQPLAIRDIKRYLFDHEAKGEGAALPAPKAPKTGKKVAVVGSGPAGLTAAHFLNQEGFAVTVFEMAAQAGGMLRNGINAFRLPRAVLDAEIAALVNSGVELKTGRPIRDLDSLFNDSYDAVLLTTGAHADLRLKLPGEDLPGVSHCVAFLAHVNQTGQGRVGKRVVVIGGGNSAMDAARTALRLGAKQVTIAAIETESQLPAHPQEVTDAAEEGVGFSLGLAPVAFQGEGRVEAIVFRPAHWEPKADGPPSLAFDSDETQTIEADTVIVAIGQRPHLAEFGLDAGLDCPPNGRVPVTAAQATARDLVFAAGDVVTGPSTVVQSMAAGRRAAAGIIAKLAGGDPWPQWTGRFDRGVGEHPAISPDLPKLPRQAMPQRQAAKRRQDFDEVELGFSDGQALAEASRCLQCGVCCECRACEEECKDIGAIDHFRTPKRVTINSPAVILADKSELPPDLSGPGFNFHEIPLRTYTPDLMDVLMEGGNQAGQVMVQAAGLRVEDPSPPVSQFTPGPPERMAFFLCACNQTMAPAGALERIRAAAGQAPGVVASQVITSVCHPDGAAAIAEAVAKENIGRVILASCVCCPLNFNCISCNDQRTRARRHLFQAHNLPASMFETINLRDHLSEAAGDEEAVVARAKDLLRAAYIRSRFQGPLRQGTTRIGRRILVLGGSEVGVSAARNLALQGFDVRLVLAGRLAGQDLPPAMAARALVEGFEPNVKVVPEADILGLAGEIGDFRVEAVTAQGPQEWRADLVCLTDENMIPLSIYAGEAGLTKFYRYDFAFFNTPQLGIYRVMPRTLKRVDCYEAGAALAGEVATAAAKAHLKDHELSPQVDPNLCRGCGRCAEICPFDAAVLLPNQYGSYTAAIRRHNCVGCGACVGRCPVTALDMPFFSNKLLESMVAGRLAREGGR